MAEVAKVKNFHRFHRYHYLVQLFYLDQFIEWAGGTDSKDGH